MVCCKAEEFGRWCYDYTSVYANSDGKEHCLFHAPEEHKGVGVEEFNEAVYKQINDAIPYKQRCNFSGTIFPGAISFSQYKKYMSLPPIIFSGARFSGEAKFSGASFSDEADFSGASFSDEVDFSGVTFNGKADFIGAEFSSTADFFGAKFMRQAEFESAIFSCAASFLGAAFSGEAVFFQAKFDDSTDFMSATFSDYTEFTSATFSDDANFSNVTFSKVVEFEKAVFIGNVNFGKAIFSGETTFEEAEGKTFRSNVLFTRVKVGSCGVFFRGLDLSSIPVSFLETDLANFRFDRCVWPRKKSSGLFAQEDAEVFHDEIQADCDFANVKLWKKWSNTDLLKRYGMIEDLYRQMKQQYKATHNEPEVSKWHYREKEMYRKKKVGRRYNPFGFTNLYWAFSGYGERPFRAGVMLVVLSVIITIAMNWLGLVSPTGEPNIQGFSFLPDWTKIGLAIQATIEHTLFVKDPIFIAKPGLGAIILALWTKLLIPIQAALFVFALRNKFRR